MEEKNNKTLITIIIILSILLLSSIGYIVYTKLESKENKQEETSSKEKLNNDFFDKLSKTPNNYLNYIENPNHDVKEYIAENKDLKYIVTYKTYGRYDFPVIDTFKLLYKGEQINIDLKHYNKYGYILGDVKLLNEEDKVYSIIFYDNAYIGAAAGVKCYIIIFDEEGNVYLNEEKEYTNVEITEDNKIISRTVYHDMYSGGSGCEEEGCRKDYECWDFLKEANKDEIAYSNKVYEYKNKKLELLEETTRTIAEEIEYQQCKMD